METKAERIKRLRVARGFSQQGLADALIASGADPTISKTTVSKWELGDSKDLKDETFVLLCQVLATDGPYLVWGEDRRPKRHRAPAAKIPANSNKA